jgi:hypothetical protein
MHYRRIASFLLGLWLGGGLFMAWVATENFHSVDRLLAQPSPLVSTQIKALGTGGARLLLRYQAAEQNRWYFESWEAVQIVLGTGFFFFLLFGSSEGKFSLLLALLMLLIVLVQRFLLTPELVGLGRTIDFIPADVPSTERNKFWMVHGAYSGIEILKWGLGLVLGARIIWLRAGRSGDTRQDLDLIDKADHRHVNR